MNYKDDEALLEENGWTVECQSPFEIRNEESNSFATGEAAYIVLRSLEPRDRSPRSLILDLEPDDKYYVDKLNILHKLVTEPNVGHIIPKHIANWCKSVGLCAEASCEDRTSWWTCRVKDKDNELFDSLENELTYAQCLKLTDRLYDWMAEQKYDQKALLHAAVCCDYAGMVHFKVALTNQINKFFNEK
jgi:hypothetical protein